MKLVMAFIRPNLYSETKSALSENRFFAMSTKEVLGRGKKSVDFTVSGSGSQKSSAQSYSEAFVAKKMIEIVVKDEDVDRLIDTILSVNSKNTNGDGKIFVLPVERCLRIHTGETGNDALI